MAASYRAPQEDMRFVLHDLLGDEALFARLGMPDANRELVDAVLEEGARFTEAVLAPLNAVGDAHGCKLDQATGAVTTPPGFADAYAQFVAGGWSGLAAPAQWGGQGLPHVVDVADGAGAAAPEHGEDFEFGIGGARKIGHTKNLLRRSSHVKTVVPGTFHRWR